MNYCKPLITLSVLVISITVLHILKKTLNEEIMKPVPDFIEARARLVSEKRFEVAGDYIQSLRPDAP